MKRWLLLIAVALVAACSTTPTPGVCCVGPGDCSRLDLTEARPCPAGQACVELQCVAATCSNLGCPPEAPICDDDTCRGCQLDTECPSGACGDDGACIAEADVVYLAPAGVDAGTCSRDAPCRRIQFGATKTSATRNHIVMTTGLYDLGGESESIEIQHTPASRIFIHGSGSALHTTTDGGAFTTYVDAVIRDLEIVGGGAAIRLASVGRSALEHIKIRGPSSVGIAVAGDALMRNLTIEGTETAISLGFAARLTLDRATIKNPGIGIASYSPTAIVDITNVLIHGATEVAFDLVSSGGGTVSFTTIADSGTDTGSGPRAFRCPPSGVTVRSSIIWAPGNAARPAIDGGCALLSTIVGPTAVPGATNVDPLFIGAASGDYHLSATSPARDLVDSGPATDFEGDPRPRGARFDIGADEAP